MENYKDAQLFVNKQMYHHHASSIISSNEHIKPQFLESLTQTIKINVITRNRKGVNYFGIEASEINREIRRILQDSNEMNLKLEAYEEDGVFYFSEKQKRIAGFDFAIIDDETNLIRLRNRCFGKLQYANKDKRWNDFFVKNPKLNILGEQILTLGKAGEDIEIDQDNGLPLIVGEIQFGNWALAYRDFFKVLKADVYNTIDCLIYIVPTGNLENMLSDGIVTYDKTEKIIREFEKVLTVPIWLIGIDIEIRDGATV